MQAAKFERCLDEAPIPRRVVAIAMIAGAAVIFDGYDLQALAYSLPKIVGAWHVRPVQAGLLASYTFVGLFVGAVGLGMLGDRWGRKRVLVLGVTAFALIMGTAGFAQTYAQFAALRFLAAIGMGGVLPGTIAMLSGYVSVRRRARMIALSAGCFTTGFVAAAVAATFLVPRYGWRPLFFLSYAAAIVAVMIALWVPESPQYLAGKGRFDEALASLRKVYPRIWETARTADPADFFASENSGAAGSRFGTLWTATYRGPTVVISFLYLFLQFVVYALDFWMVSLLVAHGFSLVHSYSYAIEQAAAATIGGLLFGWILDRVDQYLALAVIFAAGGVCLIAFGYAGSLFALYALNALAGAFVIGGQNVAHTLVMAVYPPDTRATGMGWALGIGRLGGLLGPPIGGYLLSLALPFPAYFLFFAVPAIFCSITVVVLRYVVRQARVVRSGAPTADYLSA
jgi:AAHS family benzoate transporter-like MFS transporter